MTLLKRISGFVHRFLRGEDVVIVQQTKEQWERQFATGKWDRLREGQPNTAELARLLSAKSDIAYTGIDISEAAIKAARTLVPNGNFIVADAEKPPSDMGVFDVLVFNEVLYYMNPDRVLPRYHIHATKDAHILISVAHFWRTPFVFHRIRRHLCISTRFEVADISRRWNIAIGTYYA